ncbi:hypothetical protein GQ600_24375 [Phytophthora cactorum]|nr:hypothetical protein GQ600_24375 [Phytophthora cactorum]
MTEAAIVTPGGYLVALEFLSLCSLVRLQRVHLQSGSEMSPSRGSELCDTNSVCPFDHSAQYQYCLRGFIPRGSLLYSRALVTIQVRARFSKLGGAPVDCPLEQRLRKGSFAKPSINSRSSPLSSRALVPLRAAPLVEVVHFVLVLALHPRRTSTRCLPGLLLRRRRSRSERYRDPLPLPRWLQ